jgi:hypothetical protein
VNSDRLRSGRPGLDSRQWKDISLLTTASRPALGTIQPPVQWIAGDSSLAGKATEA